MRQLAVDLGERSYSIFIDRGLINNHELVESYCSGENVLIFSNETIAPLYLQKLESALPNKKVFNFLIPDGESFKNLENFSKVIDFLIQNRFRRNDTLIALGGGVIGDLGGFVAASYQRGMNFIQFPTTLLAQVDSSVGGKTAVNHPLGKNMIGAFYQPKAVFIDTDTLKSLPQREYISGFAEVIKYAMLGSLPLKKLLTSKTSKIQLRDENVLAEIIYFSCERKAAVVSEDETEAGSRALLNLGHTFGHALERLTEYKTFLHGEAVSIGIMMAMNLALSKNLMQHSAAVEYTRIIKALGLPHKTSDKFSPLDYLDAMKLDKKNTNSYYRLVLPTGENCIIVEEEDLALIERAIAKQIN